MAECTYCNSELQKTEGKLLIARSGDRLHFCSGKCEKNWEKDRSHDYSETG